ncbi:MAG: M1 family peptidase [Bacteroidetes bacterium]|nr:MAG: M1 family peptidase [Bacteroidota bacterium]
MNFKNKFSFLLLIITSNLFWSCETKKENEKQNQNTKNMTTITDIHTFAKPNESIMTHISLDLKVNFEEKTLAGKAIIDIKNAENAKEFWFDSKSLQIEKITLDENETTTTFKINETKPHVGAGVQVNIKPETKKINVYYKTDKTAAALQWLSPTQTAGKKNPFLFTQSQAILARSWVPCQDSPGIRFTYNAKISVPKGLMALMSAENPEKISENGVYEFKMTQKIPAYLLALSVGELAYKKYDDRSGVYAEPIMLEKSHKEFEDLPKMIEAAEELYGKYAWEKYDVLLLPPSFPFGGMENPRLTFATPTILAGDKSLTSLIAHELAHSWSGNLVTNATWDDFWLNEGFTVYFERRIMEKIKGKSYAKMLEFLGYQDLQKTLNDLKDKPKDTHLKLDLKDRDPDDGVTEIAYEKGYFFLRTIEELVGREKMDNFIKNYFQKNAFQSMNTENFVEYLQKNLPETSKMDLKEWIYAPNLPKNCPKVSADRFENIDKELAKFKENKEENLAKDISSHEWLYFIRGLGEKLTLAQMENLDKKYQFTTSNNAEILTAWLDLSIRSEYKKAYPKLESFLNEVGRRKFLMPLYTSLLKSNQKDFAKQIYQKSRQNYHAVATNSLDELLK